MLTKKMLEAMPECTIFATGLIVDSPEGANMANSGKELRWVAQRGFIYDWTIYILYAEHSIEYVTAHGDKVRNECNIRRLVECDDEAFALYRQPIRKLWRRFSVG